MKKLLLVIILLAGCKKEECWTCEWKAESAHYHNTWYIAQSEQVCDRGQKNDINGTWKQVVDGGGNKVYAHCECK